MSLDACLILRMNLDFARSGKFREFEVDVTTEHSARKCPCSFITDADPPIGQCWLRIDLPLSNEKSIEELAFTAFLKQLQFRHPTSSFALKLLLRQSVLDIPSA
jgi:hypothetical protein